MTQINKNKKSGGSYPLRDSLQAFGQSGRMNI